MLLVARIPVGVLGKENEGAANEMTFRGRTLTVISYLGCARLNLKLH